MDDAVALCLAFDVALRQGGDFIIKAITCVHGNTTLANVRTNVAKCRDLFNAYTTTPIHSGAACPLGMGAPFLSPGDDAWHGKDGLGDAPGIPTPRQSPLDSEDAIKAILRVSDEAKGVGAELYIVTLGPLTNLAQLLMHKPGFGAEVAGLFVMGGCGDARGNASRVAEFNVLADVSAACKVFEEWRAPLTVVSWELSKKATIPWLEFDQWFFADNNRVSNFMSKICRKPYGIGERNQHKGAVICDALCVACFIDDSIITAAEMVHVEVENTQGICRGMTVLDMGQAFGGTGRERNVRWVTEVDEYKWQKLLKTLLCSREDI